MAEQKRVMTRIHDRKLDRQIAKNRMKEEGLKNVCKHSYSQGMSLNGKKGDIIRHDSYFAEHWREYAY